MQKKIIRIAAVLSLLCSWAVQLNLVSIGVSATAYYLWFSVSYDFSTLYIQAQKLTADLQVLFGVFPKWGLFVLAWIIFDK